MPWRHRREAFSKLANENPPEAEFRAGPLRSKHSALSKGAARSMLTSDSATHYNEDFNGLIGADGLIGSLSSDPGFSKQKK
jgi:hypothetical protein